MANPSITAESAPAASALQSKLDADVVGDSWVNSVLLNLHASTALFLNRVATAGQSTQ